MRRALQLAGRAGFAVGMGGVVVGMAASPAFAASGSLSVTPTGTVDHNVVIKAVGTYDNSMGTSTQSMKLSVNRPDSSSAVLYSGSAQPLSSGSTPSESVDTSALNLNGDYVFTFTFAGSSTSKTVTMRIAPAKVSGFGGNASGTVAHFTWAANSEPDLAGYDLVDVTDSSPRDLTPGGVGTNVCDSSGCAVDIDFGSSAAGTSRSFVIDALRYTSPSHSAEISSGDSAPATVSFPAPPPPPSSAPAASGSGTTSGGSGTAGSSSGGTTSGGTAGGQAAGGRSGHSISASRPSAALKAYLPSFSAGAAPNLPSVVTEVKPLPEGTYKPTLAYPDQVVNEAVHHDTKGVAAVRSEIVRVLNVAAVWKTLAGAVLVLLVAAHLRAWVAGIDVDG
jgi:hypothetical protein